MDHTSHALEVIEDEAERQKIEMKSMIETKRRNLQAKLTAVSKLDEDYPKIIQRGEEVKRDVRRTVDNLIANIEAKKQTIFAAVEAKIKKSLESLDLTMQKTEVENKIEVIKSSSEVPTLNSFKWKKWLKTFLARVQTTKPTARDPKGLPILAGFRANQEMLKTVNTEQLGTL